MGFRNGAWMSVFEVKPTSSEYITQIRGTTSVRHQDGGYETDFSGFCSCVGEDVAKKIRSLSPMPTKEHPARIRLLRTEVKSPSVKVGDEWKQYTNFNIYDFDFGENELSGETTQPASKPAKASKTYEEELDIAYEGISDDVDEEGLPF